MYRISLPIALFFLFAIPPSLVAQTGTDTSLRRPGALAELSLEELMNVEVFTAAKKFQRLGEAPAIISVINSRDIERMGVTSLIDVFRYVPGIETSIGPDGSYRLSNRGLRKEGNILVMINGQPMNDFYNGKPVFDLPVDFIDRIEIVRGPGSALFGTNAVAAVINIFTVSTRSVSMKGGSNNTYSENLNYNFERDKFQVSLSGGFIQSDGGKASIETDAGDRPGNEWDLTLGSKAYTARRWNRDGYFSTVLSAGNLSWKVFGLGASRSQWAGPLFIAAPGSKHKTSQLLSSLSYTFKVKDNLTIIPKVYFNGIRKDNLNKETPDNYVSTVVPGQVFFNGKQTREQYLALTKGAEIDISFNIAPGFNLLSGTAIENLSLPWYDLQRNYRIVGDEYKGEFGNYDTISLVQKGKRRTVYAYWLQGDYKLKKLNFTGGVRIDNYSDFGYSFNPRIGINFNAARHWRLRGLYGKAFRAPTFLELYDNTTLGNEFGVEGNDQLSPEVIQTSEIGAEYNSEKLIVRYNLFYNFNQSLIRVYDSRGNGGMGVYENIGDSRSYGHEAEAIAILAPRLNFFVNYSHFLNRFSWDEKNSDLRKADLIFFDRRPECDRFLKNIPAIRINAGINFSLNKFSFFTGLNYGSRSVNNNRFYLESVHFVKIPAYLQGNFNITYHASPQVRIRLAVNNIGKKYSDPDESTDIDEFGRKGLVQPGETILFSLSYSFLK